MLLIIAILIFVLGTIALIHGASVGKPEWCQRQLDDEQMKAVSKQQRKKLNIKKS